MTKDAARIKHVAARAAAQHSRTSQVRVLDGPQVTSDHITELLHGIVTDEQRRELDLCGSVRFTYAAEHSTHFSVRVGIQGKNVSMNIKNLDP